MKLIGVEVRARQADAQNGEQTQELAIFPLEFVFPEVPVSADCNYPVFKRELEVTFHTTDGDLTTRVDLYTSRRASSAKPTPLEIAAHQVKK